MSKHYFYLGKGDEALRHALEERIEEEGGDASGTIKYLISLSLGTSDPREAVTRQDVPEYDNLVQKSLALPRKWWIEVGLRADEEGYPSMMAMVREWIREKMDFPLPAPKPPRAKRDPALSRAIILEHQIESFNDMRNLRTSQEGQPKPVEKKVWDRIRENPEEFFHVNNCRVDGCRNDQMGLHRHPGKHLGKYADEVEAGGMT